MDKNQVKKKYNILFVIGLALYILVQPVLDIYKSLAKVKLEIFGISFIEIVNLILITFLVVVTFINNGKQIKSFIKKKKIFVFLLVFGYLLYLFLHVYNILQFDSTIFPDSNINIFVEVYYIFRALLEPLILVLCVLINKTTKNVFYNIITILTIMVSGLIVVSNVFGFSLVAYSDTNKVISDNIFGWFHYTLSDTYSLTSKGLFSSANELSNLLLILLPINIYRCLKQSHGILWYGVLFIQIISMIMLGTKTATLGSIAILLGTVFLIMIISIKERIGFKSYIKKTLPICIISILFSGITWYSPLFLAHRNVFIPAVDEDPKEPNFSEGTIGGGTEESLSWNDFKNIKCNALSGKEKELAMKYMNNEYYYHKIDLSYLDAYTVENDPLFWCDIFQKQSENQMGNRMLKVAIFERIMERNNRKSDSYLGLGYTLNMLVPETDYYHLYYQFGLCGLLVFVGPYLGLFMISLFYFFKNLKKKFTYENILLFVSAFGGLVSPHVSGHSYGILFITLPLSLVIVMLYFCCKGELE